MADEEHLRILRQGVDAWNEWRSRHPDIRPDLSGASLRRADLERGARPQRGEPQKGAPQSGGLTKRADLSRADLSGRTSVRADLSRADLERAANLEPGNVMEWTCGYAIKYVG